MLLSSAHLWTTLCLLGKWMSQLWPAFYFVMSTSLSSVLSDCLSSCSIFIFPWSVIPLILFHGLYYQTGHVQTFSRQLINIWFCAGWIFCLFVFFQVFVWFVLFCLNWLCHVFLLRRESWKMAPAPSPEPSRTTSLTAPSRRPSTSYGWAAPWTATWPTRPGLYSPRAASTVRLRFYRLQYMKLSSQSIASLFIDHKCMSLIAWLKLSCGFFSECVAFGCTLMMISYHA